MRQPVKTKTMREEKNKPKGQPWAKVADGPAGAVLQNYKTTIQQYFTPTYLTMTYNTTKKSKKTIFRKLTDGRTDGCRDGLTHRHSDVQKLVVKYPPAVSKYSI